MLCVSEQSCNQGFGTALGGCIALVLLAAALQTSFYLNISGMEYFSGRCRWRLKMLFAPVLMILGLHMVVYFSFQDIWQHLTSSQAGTLWFWWMYWSLAAMQVAFCNQLSSKALICATLENSPRKKAQLAHGCWSRVEGLRLLLQVMSPALFLTSFALKSGIFVRVSNCCCPRSRNPRAASQQSRSSGLRIAVPINIQDGQKQRGRTDV